MAPNPPLQLAEPSATLTIHANFHPDLGYDKQGSEIREDLSSKNAY